MLVTMWTVASAGRATRARNARIMSFFILVSSERMGAVGANRKLQLKKRFVGGHAARIAAAPDLPAHLGELARPEGQGQRLAAVAQPLVVRAVGELVARAGKQPTGELVIAARVEAPGCLCAAGLLPPAAEELAAQDEGAVRPSLK